MFSQAEMVVRQLFEVDIDIKRREGLIFFNRGFSKVSAFALLEIRDKIDIINYLKYLEEEAKMVLIIFGFDEEFLFKIIHLFCWEKNKNVLTNEIWLLLDYDKF